MQQIVKSISYPIITHNVTVRIPLAWCDYRLVQAYLYHQLSDPIRYDVEQEFFRDSWDASFC